MKVDKLGLMLLSLNFLIAVSRAQESTIAKGYVAKVWGAATGQELVTQGSHTDWVTNVAFSPDGTRLASTWPDCSIASIFIASSTNSKYAVRLEEEKALDFSSSRLAQRAGASVLPLQYA